MNHTDCTTGYKVCIQMIVAVLLVVSACNLVAASPDKKTVRFAVIGDYGSGSKRARNVADLVKSLKPDFITTVGDNNYPAGSADTIDKNIGQFYHAYIYPYKGKYGPGAGVNRFFPIPGHRDWDSDRLQPYLDYFQLPGNEHYYDFTAGPVHFFMLDTDPRTPDGADIDSVQARWLQKKLSSSTAPWKLVYSSHAPYTSHKVADIERMRWPFAKWGADAVLSGYFHVYERLSIDGIPYFINGAGGSTISEFGKTDPASKVRLQYELGAMLVTADPVTIRFEYYNIDGQILDRYSIKK